MWNTGRAEGALSSQPPQEKERGIPSHSSEHLLSGEHSEVTALNHKQRKAVTPVFSLEEEVLLALHMPPQEKEQGTQSHQHPALWKLSNMTSLPQVQGQ